MDIMTPILDGISATEQIKSAHAEVNVIGFTAYDNPSLLCRLLEAGASGIIHKLSVTHAIKDAIRVVARGGSYLDPAFRFMSLHPQHRPSLADIIKRRRLSPREKFVLLNIAEGLSNHQIAKELRISIKTVETYKSRFVKKLGLRSRAQIVSFAAAEGWIRGDSTMRISRSSDAFPS
jgi:DNA-binding NarL/FixJ family response regulator